MFFSHIKVRVIFVHACTSALIVENENLLFWQNLCTKFLKALPAKTSQTTTSLQQK